MLHFYSPVTIDNVDDFMHTVVCHLNRLLIIYLQVTQHIAMGYTINYVYVLLHSVVKHRMSMEMTVITSSLDINYSMEDRSNQKQYA